MNSFKNHHDAIMVEFLGVPGVGKTTLSHMVAKSLSNNGIHVNEPTYSVNSKKKFWKQVTKLLSIIKLFVTAPKTSIYAIKIIIKSEQKTSKDLIKTVPNLLFIISTLKSSSTKKGVHILDQGFFQAIWSIEYSANHHIQELEINNLMKMVHSKRVLVIDIHAVHTEVLKRLNLRESNYSRVENELIGGLASHHIYISYEILNRLKDKIHKMNHEEKGLKFMSLNNDNDECLYTNTIVISDYIQGLIKKNSD